MSMERAERYALNGAKEITIAALESGQCLQNDSGAATAEYIEIVYKKLLELAKQAEG